MSNKDIYSRLLPFKRFTVKLSGYEKGKNQANWGLLKKGNMKEHKMAINKTQKKVIAIAIPVIVVLVGFSMIGSGYSTSWDESAITFNPVKYLAKHGVEWSLVVLLIGAFEFYWWKDRDKKSE